MDKVVQNTETRVVKVIDFFDEKENNDILNPIEEIRNPVTDLKALHKDYVTAAKIQLAPHTTREAVDKARKAFASKLKIKLDRVHATVKKSGNNNLLTLVEKPMSYIMSATKGEATINAQIIIDELEKYVPDLLKNKLNKDDIAELRALLAAYDDIKDLPLESIDKKKVKGTNALAALDQKAKAIFTELKIGINGFLSDNPTLKESFLAALAAPKMPKKSNTANIKLVDESGNPFTGKARLYDIKSRAKRTPSFKANSNGVIPIKGHKVGKFPFKLVIKGKPDIMVTVEFIKAEEVEFVVVVK